jgi:hypothetical protein
MSPEVEVRAAEVIAVNWQQQQQQPHAVGRRLRRVRLEALLSAVERMMVAAKQQNAAM